ncbi:hypothetical protein NN3_41810 [Nocardia neocaledoniensis NBRC 108232]|uniref:Uncharacterized protein n=1 Tax=Nocardia neocaledoniensis TaxID=236511 RepID=A0A317NWN2_9NOCA|nr:DUF5682 family protein [Nocardia neocaledoniensis]PWV79382.1 hypothetical protein DFR69_102445 [Nocardia neocaledoniensis]GEM33174.1 hypothetical protein NN3_41810 [Nocardia neocaledoniensis NBRC 108232]
MSEHSGGTGIDAEAAFGAGRAGTGAATDSREPASEGLGTTAGPVTGAARRRGAEKGGVTRVFGIRHHGPGSARSLRQALEEFEPDAILIEGPADADPLVGFVAADTMHPPVALLAYVPDSPARAAFWPFAVFSPEWQALRYGVDHAVPVRFCDLPASHVLAADEDTRADRTDPLGTLAAAAGYDDAERWWDSVVESVPDSAAFDAITEAMAALREDAPGPTDSAGVEPAAVLSPDPDSGPEHGDSRPARWAPLVVDEHTLRREAYMRQVLRQTLKDGAQRVAVVCGAWHAPALTGPLGPAAPDARLLKGMPKTKAALTWVPWTHSRLATSSGYGAGVTSPGWYHHLFTETERPVARWLTKVAGVLRAHDLPVSSAHIIESVRLADTLAALRDRPLPGLSEVTEAVRSVMCAGDETMLRLVIDELVVGETLGGVPEDTPTVPLAADLRARIKTLRLKQEALARTVDLDLRKDRDVERSHLLHRLRLLGIDWGTPTVGEVRNTGTFRETWALRWEPEFAVRIVEAAVWGTTLRTAAEAKILDTASRDGVSVTELADALETALLADLGGATEGLITRLEAAAALDHDVTHLLGALPGLTRTLRYGDVRGTDTKALAHVADGLLVRICAGLPGAVTGLDTDAAEALRAQIDAAHTAISTRDDEHASTEWLATLQRIADRDDVHGAIAGRAVRLLCDAERIDDADSARRLAAALSVGNTPAAKAAWIDGFLGGRGLLLVHDRELLRRIDEWLRELTEDQFVATLPLLRRTFGSFESGERRAIGQALRDTGPTTPAAATTAVDPARGQLALRAAAAILGATG